MEWDVGLIRARAEIAHALVLPPKPDKVSRHLTTLAWHSIFTYTGSPAFDRWGSLLFKLSAKCLTEAMGAEAAAEEPAYRRLFDLASNTRPLKLDEIFGLYYSAEAFLFNVSFRAKSERQPYLQEKSN